MCICARVHVCAEDTFCTSPTDLPGPHGLTQRFPGSQKWCWELGGLGTCSQPRGFQIQFLLKSGSVSATHRSRFRAGGGRVARQTRANLSAPSAGEARPSFVCPPSRHVWAGGSRGPPMAGEAGAPAWPDPFPTAVAHTGCGGAVPFLGLPPRSSSGLTCGLGRAA